MPLAMHGVGVFAALSLGAVASVLLSDAPDDPHVWSGAMMLYVLLGLSAAAAFAAMVSFGIASAVLRRFSSTTAAFSMGLGVGLAAILWHVAWYAAGPHSLSFAMSLAVFVALSAVAPLVATPCRI